MRKHYFYKKKSVYFTHHSIPCAHLNSEKNVRFDFHPREHFTNNKENIKEWKQDEFFLFSATSTTTNVSSVGALTVEK